MLKDFQGSALIVSSIQGVSHINTFLTNEGFHLHSGSKSKDQKHTYNPGHEISLYYSRLLQYLSSQKDNAKLTGCCLYTQYIILTILYYDTLFIQIIDIYMAIRNNFKKSFNKIGKQLWYIF